MLAAGSGIQELVFREDPLSGAPADASGLVLVQSPRLAIWFVVSAFPQSATTIVPPNRLAFNSPGLIGNTSGAAPVFASLGRCHLPQLAPIALPNSF